MKIKSRFEGLAKAAITNDFTEYNKIQGAVKQEQKEKQFKQDFENKKNKFFDSFRDKMDKTDFEEAQEKMNKWFEENVKTEEDYNRISKDISPFFEELGLCFKEPLCKYIVDEYINQDDFVKEIKELIEKSESMTPEQRKEYLDKEVELLREQINLDGFGEVSKDLAIDILNGLCEEFKKRTSDSKEETIVEECPVVEAEQVEDEIQFDDSNLVEVKIENDTIEGFIVRTAFDAQFVIRHEDLLSLNGKSYITKELCDFYTKDLGKEEVNKLLENDWYKKLMSTLDSSLGIRSDVFPKGNGTYDIRFFLPNDNNGSFDITFDLGTFITKQVKVILPTEKGLVGIPVGKYDNLLTNLLQYKYSLDDLQKMNCLNENVINLSQHLDLTQVPTQSLTKLVENIYSNKKLLDKVLSNYYVFDNKDKISAKHFIIKAYDKDNHLEEVTYNNGKVTTKLDI